MKKRIFCEDREDELMCRGFVLAEEILDNKKAYIGRVEASFPRRNEVQVSMFMFKMPAGLHPNTNWDDYDALCYAFDDVELEWARRLLGCGKDGIITTRGQERGLLLPDRGFKTSFKAKVTFPKDNT